jgi:FMN phosphatase YigB (HAD superfamily)/DNA-binding XRE family transcriptional regulator
VFGDVSWYYKAMDEKGLGKRLQALRVAAGLTQQMLCQRAGLSYSTLTKIERGAIKAPSIFTIQSITGVLGVGLEDVFGGASPAPRKKRGARSKSGVRFVFIDINGCLVRFYHRAFTLLASETGVPADVVETTFWHYNDAVCRGDMDMETFNTAFAKALHVPEISWLDYYLDAIEPIEPMQEMARWIADHYHVGLLTNIMPGFVPAMKQRGLLPDVHFDVVIDSSEAKAIKPEAAIYTLAAQKAGCAPAEILLIDDSRANLMAAEKAGWHVLWFDDYRPEESVAHIRDALELQSGK